MTKKNILLISPFFYPEPISTGKFNTDMAVALKKAGHHVTVLCYHPFYPKWEVVKSNEQLEGITIIRGGENLKYTNKTIIRRMVLELSFAYFVRKKIKEFQKKIDIIIPVFPPSLMFYQILPALNKQIKKVGMVHDLQEIYAGEKKGIFHKLVRFLIHKVEKKVFQSCDKLIFLSEEMKEEAKKYYQLDSKKLKVQYPFVTIQPQKVTNALNDIFTQKHRHIVYSGALGEKQNPRGLYQLFDKATKELKNVKFHFFSQGVIFDELKEKNSNSNILFHDLVLREHVEELYAKSDIQIIPQLSGTSKGSLPSKLPNLLASNCHILCITDKNSEIETLFKKYNLKTVVTTWSDDLIIEKFKLILGDSLQSFENQQKISSQLFSIHSMINTILE